MKNIIFALSVFAQICCFGQTGFNTISDYGFTAAMFSNTLYDDDGHVLLYGMAKQPGYPWSIFLSKLDTNGNVIWKKVHVDTAWGQLTLDSNLPLVKLHDSSGYALLAPVVIGFDALLVEVDNSGNLMSAKKYPDSNSTYDVYRKMIDLDDGLMMSGSKTPPNSVAGDNQIFIMRTDKQRNKLWEKWFDSPNRSDVLSSLIKIDDNEFVIGCATSNFATSLSERLPTTKIFAVDSLGNLKWEWESPLSEKSEGAVGLHENDKGEWTYSNVKIVLDSGEWRRQTMLTRRDSNFNLIWEKKAGQPNPYFSVVHDLKPAPEGGYIAVGSYNVSPFSNLDNLVTGSMYRWSDEGDSLWSRMDEGAGYTAGLDGIAPLPSGSFIACGTTLDLNKTWAWLIKVNRDGCIDTLLCMASAVPLEPEVSRTEIQVYPNPASTIAEISFAHPVSSGHIRVFDLLGQLMHEQDIAGGSFTASLSVSGWPPGLYAVQVEMAGQRRWVGKLMVTKRGE